ncbi:PAS domain S-box protein [Mesobacillus maritimus]|uniref:PAS domain S-box protein n=1 Tax=Mesobacillus maritimus TaxID=1643336 RepID=UPI00204129AA|nr:PAS domain S-box protein [Mesobacillus maritimus]MCM3584412.1 PAS domain S-box protein [Mesobacillus maritimus]
MVIFYEKAGRTPSRRFSLDEMNMILELQSYLIDTITRGDSIAEILRALSSSLEEQLQRQVYCSILLLNNDKELIVESAPNMPNDFFEAFSPIKVGPKAGSCGRAVYLNEPVFTPDIEQDPFWTDNLKEALEVGIRSCWSVPITVEGKPIGSFAIYHKEVCRPTPFDLEILKGTAKLAGFAIERDRRIHLEKQLKESEQRFKSLFDHYPESIYILSLEGDFLGFNNKSETIFGYPQEELIGKKYDCCIDQKHKKNVATHFNKAKTGIVQDCEARITHKKGQDLDLHFTFLPILVKENIVGVYGIARDVTYEKKLELELRSRHQEINHILKNHQGMIFKYRKENEQFIHTFGAGQLVKKLGVPLKEIIGKSLFHFLPEQVATRKLNYYQKAWDGEQCSYEVNLNGIAYVATLQPVYEAGEVIEVIGSCSDITELKKTHDDLRKTQELLESFVHHTVDAIATMDKDGTLTFVNQAYVDMFGNSGDELIGNKVQNVPDGYEEEFKQLVGLVYSESEVKGYETVRKRNDGSIIPVSITHAPLKDKKGIVTGVSAIIRDITEQKEIEQELEENKQRYQSLFTLNPDLVYSLDLNGVITNINPSVERLGYFPEQIVGKNYSDFVDNQSLCNTLKAFQKSVQGETQSYETGLIHRNGRRGIYHITNLPIIVNNRIVGVYGIAKDISELKRAEEYLRKSDRLSAIGQLAAGIAHEIRNPLTSIKGFMQFLKEKNGDKNYYDIMLREIDRIDLITNEFLILAKPQAKKYSRTSIRSLLKAFLPLVETQANMSNIEIVSQIDEFLPDIYCDPNQVKQVFLNVIKNAMESMPDGGRITIHVRKREGHIQILITDQGCGIAPERLKQIGEPFYSTKEKGTGLGLMIIFNIVKEHKGSIEIHSELNKGTQVDICLPYYTVN